MQQPLLPGPNESLAANPTITEDIELILAANPTPTPLAVPMTSKSGFSTKLKATSTWAKAVAGSNSFAELLDYIADNGAPPLDGAEDMVAEDCPDAAVSQPGMALPTYCFLS